MAGRGLLRCESDCCRPMKSEPTMSKNDRFFLYIHCNNLSEMRRFYTKLIGLSEIYASDQAVGYHHGSVQFTILSATEDLPVTQKWHRQPGWSGGVVPTPSWSFEFSDPAFFRDMIERLCGARVRSFDAVPQWVGYWSFVVKDPAGNTVELTHAPIEAPGDDEPKWEG